MMKNLYSQTSTIRIIYTTETSNYLAHPLFTIKPIGLTVNKGVLKWEVQQAHRQKREEKTSEPE